jgi:hypothetical protein
MVVVVVLSRVPNSDERTGAGTVAPMADSDPLVELRRLPMPIARILAGALEAEGIETDVRGGLGEVYGVEAGPFATRVYVRRSDRERAEQLLAELESEG